MSRARFALFVIAEQMQAAGVCPCCCGVSICLTRKDMILGRMKAKLESRTPSLHSSAVKESKGVVDPSNEKRKKKNRTHPSRKQKAVNKEVATFTKLLDPGVVVKRICLSESAKQALIDMCLELAAK